MSLTLITPPTTEPVSLVELKNHLRLDVAESEFIVEQTIAPGSHGVGTITGSSVNIVGYDAKIIVNAGAVPGAVTVTFQHSLNGSEWTDAEDEDSNIDADEATIYEYLGDRPFLRAVATVSGSAADFSVDVQLRSLSTVEDSVLTGCIIAARQEAEKQQGRQILEATYRLNLDRFPCGIIYPTIFPITAVNHVKYLDTAGIQQTLDDDLYVFDAFRLTPKASWPNTYPIINAVEIELVAGYESADDVPQATKQAILMLAGHYYEHREAVAAGAMSVVPMAVSDLLSVDAWNGG